MRVFLSAGEPSGDHHAAAVALALRRARPEVELEGIGGRAMESAGVRLVARSEPLGALGAVEVVGSLWRHYRLLRELRPRFRGRRYSLTILVDYPGFHLRLARLASSYTRVCYYIAPQIWAWGPWRANALRGHVHQLAVILPFEERFFREHGIPATFVGHPVMDAPPPPSRRQARKQLGIDDGRTALALFPGSRDTEIRRLWPLFRSAARELERLVPELAVVVARMPGLRYPGAQGYILADDPAAVIAAADAAICKSGTITLQAALGGLPMVIAYRLSPLTALVARRLARVPHIGLVNLVAGRGIVPELLQRAATPTALAQAVLPLLNPRSGAAAAQRAEYGGLRDRLGSPGVADRVAQIALTLVG